MQNVVGPSVVAMATKCGLGAESSRLPACYYYYYFYADIVTRVWTQLQQYSPWRSKRYVSGMSGLCSSAEIQQVSQLFSKNSNACDDCDHNPPINVSDGRTEGQTLDNLAIPCYTTLRAVIIRGPILVSAYARGPAFCFLAIPS